jgi:hypothetical protein
MERSQDAARLTGNSSLPPLRCALRPGQTRPDSPLTCSIHTIRLCEQCNEPLPPSCSLLQPVPRMGGLGRAFRAGNFP